MKNIIIVGPSRAGKTTLARKINEELNYFVINNDKLMLRSEEHIRNWISGLPGTVRKS